MLVAPLKVAIPAFDGKAVDIINVPTWAPVLDKTLSSIIKEAVEEPKKVPLE